MYFSTNKPYDVRLAYITGSCSKRNSSKSNIELKDASIPSFLLLIDTAKPMRPLST